MNSAPSKNSTVASSTSNMRSARIRGEVSAGVSIGHDGSDVSGRVEGIFGGRSSPTAPISKRANNQGCRGRQPSGLPAQCVDFSLIRPVIRILHETGADRVFSHVFPRSVIAFGVADLPIPIVSLENWSIVLSVLRPLGCDKAFP